MESPEHALRSDIYSISAFIVSSSTPYIFLNVVFKQLVIYIVLFSSRILSQYSCICVLNLLNSSIVYSDIILKTVTTLVHSRGASCYSICYKHRATEMVEVIIYEVVSDHYKFELVA